jgi:tRNA1Val (adenine37-N6)-methyltransferase
MSESSFRFRHFTIHQDKCAMKVGTDAVLLGSWIQPGHSRRILDIGTGTGILALMLAQKSTALIDAIDIDAGAFTQARENARSSPWFNRMHITNEPFQQFAAATTERYDLVVTNPPYFHEASKPAEEARVQARHTDLLPFDELIDGVKKVLLPQGRFCMILPLKEGMEFMDLAQHKGLFCHHLLRVKTRADKPAKRILMEFDLHYGLIRDEEIIMREEDTSYSKEYAALTSEYYINLK